MTLAEDPNPTIRRAQNVLFVPETRFQCIPGCEINTFEELILFYISAASFADLETHRIVFAQVFG